MAGGMVALGGSYLLLIPSRAFLPMSPGNVNRINVLAAPALMVVIYGAARDVRVRSTRPTACEVGARSTAGGR